MNEIHFSTNRTQVFLFPPADFRPCLEAVGCICISQELFLLLKRAPHSYHGMTWCNPGGRCEPGETKENAVQRELKEETGIELPQNQFEYLKTLFLRERESDFIFHLFRADFKEQTPRVTLNEEHTEFRWLTLPDVLNLSLMPGEKECYRLIYGSFFSF